MGAPLQVALALGSVGVLLGLMAVVRRLAVLWALPAEVQRKLVHIGTGLYALVLPWLFPDRWPVYLLVGVTLCVMLVLRLPGSPLGGTLHGVRRTSYGDLLLAIAVGLCLFLAGDDLYLYVLPIAVLTLADAAAALAGTAYGTRFFRVEDGDKSIEGSAVFFGVTLLLAMIVLMFMTPFAPANILVIALMVAAFGTLVEAVSWRGFDNLFLPLGLLVFLQAHAPSPLHDLVALAALFALSIVAFRTISPRIGLTNHAARVYVIAVFMLMAATAAQNALAPILVLAAHAWARSAAPCGGKYPDLDIVAGLALMSFFWLTLGTATSPSAISYYGIAATGMMVGFCALALAARALPVRLAAIGAVIVLAVAVRGAVVAINGAEANWNGPLWPAFAGCVALTAAVTLAAPRTFARDRVLRLTLLSLTVPLGAYLWAIDIAGMWT